MHMGHGLEHRSMSHLFILRRVLPESNEQSCVLCVSCLLPQQCNWLHGYAIPAVSEAEFMSELDPIYHNSNSCRKVACLIFNQKSNAQFLPLMLQQVAGKGYMILQQLRQLSDYSYHGSQQPFELNFSVDVTRSYCQKPTHFRYLLLF